MIDANEIKNKLERLPYDKQIAVFEFIDFLEHKTRKFTNDMNMELENSEVLTAAEQTGSFAFWEDLSEDIYSLSDGVPL